jgi:mono/diheme cytochrome c family protein
MATLKPPPWLNVMLLVLGTTALYTYIGQLVPQKEVLPPQETIMRADMTTDDLVQVGRGIAEGKGLCLTCHTIGKSGALRFPDLEGIATRAGDRMPEVDSLQYMARSIYKPDEFIVPGFSPGMPAINKPPIGLNDQEILAVLAFLQSLGGTPDVTLETTTADLGLE